MDAPSWTPDWEPFSYQPMMEDAFVNLQDNFWPSEGGVAPSRNNLLTQLEPLPSTPYNVTYGQIHPTAPNLEVDGMFGSAQNGLLRSEPDNLNDMLVHFHNDLTQCDSLEPALFCGEIMRDDLPALTQVFTPQHLAELPESQLEAIAQNVAKAIETRKQKIPENFKTPVTGYPPQGAAKEKRHHADRIDKSKPSRFECEHPGCAITFRRRKDRTRHFRHKHVSRPGFQCPIVDCPLGTGHETSRSDKLRDHLNGNAASSRTWRCVIPGCSETAVGRVALIHHIWRHDGSARRGNLHLLVNYGLLNFRSSGYSLLQFVCARGGCPFGTNSLEIFEKHRTIPHNGPTCPCPILSCQLIYKDWEETSAHLAKDHSYSVRMLHRDGIMGQGFEVSNSSFSCPLCHYTYLGCYGTNIARRHCLSHNLKDVITKARAVVEAYRFFADTDHIWSPRKFSIFGPSNIHIFACLALSAADWEGIQNTTDLDQALSERGITGL